VNLHLPYGSRERHWEGGGGKALGDLLGSVGAQLVDEVGKGKGEGMSPPPGKEKGPAWRSRDRPRHKKKKKKKGGDGAAGLTFNGRRRNDREEGEKGHSIGACPHSASC